MSDFERRQFEELEHEAHRLRDLAFGGCPHFNAVPVDLVDTDEVVAWLCPECDSQLPVEWKRPTFGLAAVLGIEVTGG